MLVYITGIIAMLGGFTSLAMGNVDGAYVCFGFMFILWCLIAIFDYHDGMGE
jgi:hypothetical protein